MSTWWISRRRLGASVAMVIAVVAGAAAQEAKDDAAKADAARHLMQLKQAAMQYRIETETSPPRMLELVPEPVLRWTNPLRQTDDGAVFLWVAGGRPEAIASFYRHRREGVLAEDHEFQSLATSGLSATRDGVSVWSPREPGIMLAPIPNAPKPVATPAERLRQMRALAREFRASFDLPKNQSDLRLLTKPLYRYATNRPDLLDGALFAFVQTTDPEVLLLIEARPVGGTLAWHYAFARMSMVNLKAQHKERDVWRVPWEYDLASPGKPYITISAPTQSR